MVPPHPNLEGTQFQRAWNPGSVTFGYTELPPVTLSRHDFFAGMALNAFLSQGKTPELASEQAWRTADIMVKYG